MKRISIIGIVLLLTVTVAIAQDPIPVECGDIVENEFTENDQAHLYTLELSAGTQMNVSGVAVGDILKFSILISAPNEALIGRNGGEHEATPSVDSGVVSANGIYTVTASNAWRVAGDSPFSRGYGGVGVYTLFISCILRDGRVIEPGDETPSTDTSAPSAFSGVGFPGLAPVDFTAAFRLPFQMGTTNRGEIPQASDAVLGFTFDANAGDELDLNFTRISGNLNLGLVVLSADNKVVFQASLVTSETLATRFTLPSAGQYTIGVFRIDLLPPANPEATEFQVEGTLNP